MKIKKLFRKQFTLISIHATYFRRTSQNVSFDYCHSSQSDYVLQPPLRKRWLALILARCIQLYEWVLHEIKNIENIKQSCFEIVFLTFRNIGWDYQFIPIDWMISIQWRYVARGNLSEFQFVFVDRRQALSLPDEIVGHEGGQEWRFLEYWRHRSSCQLNCAAADTQCIFGATIIHSEIVLFDIANEEKVFCVSVVFADCIVHCHRVILPTNAIVGEYGNAMMEPVNIGLRQGSHLTFDLGIHRQFGVDNSNGGMHFRRNCNQQKPI